MSDETVTGYASCLNGGCDQFGEYREVEFVETETREKASDLPVVITANKHRHLVDDSDANCPDCGQPCSLMPVLPPNIPKVVR